MTLLEREQVKYFILKYLEANNAYPNCSSKTWEYITDKDFDKDDAIDLNVPLGDLSEEWKTMCDTYINEFFTDKEFMDHLLETKFKIITAQQDLKTPHVYNLTDGTLKYSSVKMSRYLAHAILTCGEDKIKISLNNESSDDSGCEYGSSSEDCSSNKENDDAKLTDFLRRNEPEFFENLQLGDGIFFGDIYRNDGYFFFDGESIVSAIGNYVPGTHDYGVPPIEVRHFYPFVWEIYGFLSDIYESQNAGDSS